MSGEVFSALQALRGTELVEEVRIFGADPVTGERGKATDRLEVEPNALVFSYDHQVLVEGRHEPRRIVPGLASPRPIGATLPGAVPGGRLQPALLTRAFDDVLAPIMSHHRQLPAYLDPALTPEDFLDWLAGWVGVLLDETWPIERRRAFVAVAAEPVPDARHGRWAADARRAADRHGCGRRRQWRSAVVDHGRGHHRRATALTRVTVKVRQPKRGAVEPARIDALVAAAKPAHVVHQIALAGAGES